MKLNKIYLFFLLAFISSVAMRFYSLYYTIEPKTGFFTPESGGYGTVLLVLIFVFCFATAVFAFFAYSRPDSPPEGNIALSVSAVLTALAVLYETFFSTVPFSGAVWQVFLLNLSGILTALYLLLFAVLPFLQFKIPAVLSAIPTVYFIARLICDFTTISKLALISDNILLIGAYCFILLFMLNFAKLYNNSDTEKNFKKLLSTGLGAVILCFTNSIPHIVYNLANDFSYLHTSMYSNITLLFFGIFILSFLCSHFSNKNLNK